MSEQTPTDIARQALKELVQRRLPPTPENFRRAYDDIAGHKSEDALQMLIRLLRDAGTAHARWLGLAVQMEHAAEKGDSPALEQLVRQLIPAGSVAGNWGDILHDVLKELEANRPGYTLSKKREALERVLTNFGGDPEALASKLQGLAVLWRGNLHEMTPEQLLELEVSPSQLEDSAPGAPAAASFWWRDMLVQSLEFGILPRLQFLPELERHGKDMLEQARNAKTDKEMDKLGDALKSFWYRLEVNRDAEKRLHEALLQLMRLLIDNVSELVLEDEWMAGQIKMLQDIMARPLEIEALYDAESALKELLFKQGKMKHGLTEARDNIKRMAEDFVGRLAQITEDTGQYHEKVAGYQSQISHTEDITELNVLLDGLMRDTHSMQVDALRAHDEIKGMQEKADQAKAKMWEMVQEISQLSEIAQQDYLTGALNRRGMQEAFDREFSRAERTQTPVSIAVLDVDHFKKLNDEHGHAAGDGALQHLAQVTRETLRPTDILARYGGEEFVIILPETGQEEGMQVMARVQRELTRKFFLHNNQKILMTFSAGVAQRQAGEMRDEVIQRADEAMYQAKRAGRNRVFSAEP